MKYVELVLVADSVEYQSAFNSKRKVISRLVNAVNYVDLDTTAESLGIASNLAHGIGHNLGMDHDFAAPKCVCADKKAGCIMAEARGLQPAQVFSSCSRDALQRSLARGIGMCLYNLPDPSLLVRGQKCGNSYVDPDEECDCGKPEVWRVYL
ncbi:hypothetical protein chiPu_0016310 [Chiloscyllium punctatum]|uniref:Peptidase M12B domain-containing protein n=1 Tax=Chiloscyllium punctatum TaxID=137246 RepID=A0A401T550_CHIPU|nr:hypothetical protein [Chiloscyllium punctatum]